MDLNKLLEATLPGLGYELVALEIVGRGLLRVFIDKPEGIGIEDCVSVSNHLTNLFAVENIDYDRLEVSSPGLDRPLTKPQDFNRFAGRQVQLKLRLPIDGQKRLTGTLLGLNDTTQQVRLAVSADRTLDVPLSNLDRAKLVPEL